MASGLLSYRCGAPSRFGSSTETTPIWLANLSDSKIEKIPRENSNDYNPL
jgi:hypothetical protein